MDRWTNRYPLHPTGHRPKRKDGRVGTRETEIVVLTVRLNFVSAEKIPKVIRVESKSHQINERRRKALSGPSQAEQAADRLIFHFSVSADKREFHHA